MVEEICRSYRLVLAEGMSRSSLIVCNSASIWTASGLPAVDPSRQR